MKSCTALILCLFALSISYGQDKNWKVVDSLSGSSSTNTDDIVVHSNKWKVVWTADNPSQAAIRMFEIRVFDSNTQEPVDIVVQTLLNNAPERGETIERSKGTFFLKIESYNAQWKVKVEEPLK